jgi:hypothetical protein
MDLMGYTCLQDVFGSCGVDCGDKQGVIRSSWRRFPDQTIDFLIPALPFAFVWVDIVVKDSEIAWEERLDISHY